MIDGKRKEEGEGGMMERKDIERKLGKEGKELNNNG